MNALIAKERYHFHERLFETNTLTLDDESQWHISVRDSDGNLTMSKLSCDIFAQKIEIICEYLGYKRRDRASNIKYLETLVKVI